MALQDAPVIAEYTWGREAQQSQKLDKEREECT